MPATIDIAPGAPKKQIKLCILDLPCASCYMSSGQWKSPTDKSTTKDRLKYYLDLAKVAEKGKISAIFFADWYAGFETYANSLDPMLKAGHQTGHMDPVPIISAMAAVTESLAFAATASTSYVNPYILARQFSTLDHLSEGRIGWNIVTSWSKAAANALGAPNVVPHDERYVQADEYMEVVYKLWESSWADDAATWDAEKGIGYDPTKIKYIEHNGKYHQMKGRSQVHPSPQRTPVLFQAGTSRSGTSFAAKHAEAMFLNTATPTEAAKFIKGARAEAAAQGRDPASLKFFPCIMPIIGKDSEDAKAKHATALKYADPIAGLAQFSGYAGIDMSQFPLDEPVELSEKPGVSAVVSTFRALEALTPTGEPWTPRRLGYRMAMGGLHPQPCGSAAEVADVFEEWIKVADVDGFTIGLVTNPQSSIDIVELLVPELQRRGLFWEDYDVPGGTFRENLMGPGQHYLRDDHYGRSFKYGNGKEVMQADVACDQADAKVPEVKTAEISVPVQA
ncbi:DszA family xenobiotic compound monooxygenase-1 [Coleophoma crateriformis]|uniref:DszA family xenobiotic compound monooxygenase-1 n=1 Tax=Coleophoma crateriformis TaxID=565419 RepID=A0A3D8SAU7_9HELO|nr:DszA family xenobiotic compound monooxygenase-1 [Coleophoma crateriformis]